MTPGTRNSAGLAKTIPPPGGNDETSFTNPPFYSTAEPYTIQLVFLKNDIAFLWVSERPTAQLCGL